MQTFHRICIEDYEKSDKSGQTLKLKRGTEYLTSAEVDGEVTVLTTYWLKVPVKLFAGEKEFTKPSVSCKSCGQYING